MPRKQSGIMQLVAIALVLAGLVLSLAACQRSGSPALELTNVFGTGYQDMTPVLCTVGDIKITQGAFDKRYAELSPQMKARFSGEGWEKRFLRHMVDEALQVHEALDRKLHLDPQVSQQLLTMRREVLLAALRNEEFGEKIVPTEEQIRQHFEQNQSEYVNLAAIHARHVQCKNEADARAAYKRLRQGGFENEFARVVAEYSQNPESAQLAGDLGWFNPGGFVAALSYGRVFSQRVADWEIGLHEPFALEGDWHVVEILRREPERPQTLAEARDRVIEALKPLLAQERQRAFLIEARRRVPIQYEAGFRPGGGRSPEDLFKAAWFAGTPDQQIDIYEMILDDFPESDYVDDTLFMLANVYIDRWGDVRNAGYYLALLLKEHPRSEYVEQARYMIENLGKEDFLRPRNIDDLRKLAR